MPHLFAALCDLAELALGCNNCQTRITGGPSPTAVERMGGIVYLSSNTAALHVAVLAAPDDCRSLARRLLGQCSTTQLPDALVRGAMCELTYLLAGGVKRRLTGLGAISVGSAAFVEGTVVPKIGWTVQTIDVQLDAIAVTLVCMMPDELAQLL